MLPSWMRSRNGTPRLVYFLAMEMTSRRLASAISVLAWCVLAAPLIQLLVSLDIFLVGHARKSLQRLDLLFLGFDDGLLPFGFALEFQIPDDAQARVNLVADVLRHADHLLNDPLFVTKPGKGFLELRVEPLELVEELFPGGSLERLLPARILFIHPPVQVANLFGQPTQDLQMPITALYFLVHNHPVKPFFGRLGNQLFRQRDVLLGGKTEAVNEPLLIVLGRFHPLA